MKGAGWLAIAGFGALGGLLLGTMAVGGATERRGGPASYAELTGNPAALSVDSRPIAPCYDCGDGYGAAMRLRAAHDARMDREFRELGAIPIDYDADPSDDYRYGGTFDDGPMGDDAGAPHPVVMLSPAAHPAGATTDVSKAADSGAARPVVAPTIALVAPDDPAREPAAGAQ